MVADIGRQRGAGAGGFETRPYTFLYLPRKLLDPNIHLLLPVAESPYAGGQSASTIRRL